MIHIGKLIEAELRRQERPVSWFARKLYCERTNVYDIFKRRSIDTEMLLRISVVCSTIFSVTIRARPALSNPSANPSGVNKIRHFRTIFDYV